MSDYAVGFEYGISVIEKGVSAMQVAAVLRRKCWNNAQRGMRDAFRCFECFGKILNHLELVQLLDVRNAAFGDWGAWGNYDYPRA